MWKRSFLVILSLCFLACTDTKQGGSGDHGPPGILVLEDAGGDVPLLSTDTVDAGVEDGGDASCEPHCGEEYEYQQLCWYTQLWFCTPDGLPPGDDPALYQQQVILDICNAEGVPCSPEGPNDPNCTWQIIHLGDCEDWLQCDPTDPDQQVQEDVPCEGTDEQGELYNGTQDIYCQKGQLIAGPCDPCVEEICDGKDNDCDGVVDEGQYPCSTECGDGEAICIDGELLFCNAPLPEEEVCNYLDDDCDDEVDEGQTNACGVCGPVPEDICNGLDDDCNGTVDTAAIDANNDGVLDPLLQGCETACGEGYQQCFAGQWGACSAQQPFPEQCNGEDDDCDGLVDEDLDCACPVDMADNPLTPENEGILIPCLEEPLICGQGWKTCVCEDEFCMDTVMTECRPLCVYMPEVVPAGEVCDEDLGLPIPEMCNNFDDDCDEDIDEDLLASCYSGPEETLNVGICHGGQLVCKAGVWGNYPNQEQQPDVFVGGFCLDEQTPLEEDICNDADDNCDGIIEEVMEPTDILFVLDGSGSMSDEIEAVVNALSMFAANYSDSDVIQWGLVIGPSDVGGGGEHLYIAQNLTDFMQFIGVLAAIDGADLMGGSEMLYDAVYLSIHNLVDPLNLPVAIAGLQWSGVGPSVPSMNQFNINWRADTHHVVIVFSDEEGQSYINPQISQQNIIDAAGAADDLMIYTFSPANFQNSVKWNGDPTGWAPISVGGSWFPLSNQANLMFDNLMQILDETACGGGEEEVP